MDKKPSRAYRAVWRTLKAIYPKMEIQGAENLPEGGAILVGNHAQIHGPLAAELYFPEGRYTWCAAEMMTLGEVPAYAYRDFWSQKPKYSQWLYHILSYLIAPLAVFLFNNANTIPVYHDTRVLRTFRETVKRLCEGNKIVIFPEQDRKYNHILYEFQKHFADTALMYYKKSGKPVFFVPMYITPRLRRIVFGPPVTYNPELPLEEERSRICDALKTEITALAMKLPRHTVIPYRNIPKRDYPSNIPDEVKHP